MGYIYCYCQMFQVLRLFLPLLDPRVRIRNWIFIMFGQLQARASTFFQNKALTKLYSFFAAGSWFKLSKKDYHFVSISTNFCSFLFCQGKHLSNFSFKIKPWHNPNVWWDADKMISFFAAGRRFKIKKTTTFLSASLALLVLSGL